MWELMQCKTYNMIINKQKKNKTKNKKKMIMIAPSLNRKPVFISINSVLCSVDGKRALRLKHEDWRFQDFVN